MDNFSKWGLGLLIFISANNLLAKPLKNVKSLGITYKPVTYPRELLTCNSKAECASARGLCGQWVSVNKAHSQDFEKYFIQASREAECSAGKGEIPPKSECVKQLCETVNHKGSGEQSVQLWGEQCPEKEIEESIQGLEEPLKKWVIDLQSPLGWKRKAALIEMEKMGTRAEKSIPWVLNVLKNADNFSNLRESPCFIGEKLSEELVVRVLGALNPNAHPALPFYSESLKDENQLYRHADILRQLKTMGSGVATILGALETVLDKSADKKWSEERGPLALEVVEGLGAAAKPLLASLQKWLDDTSVMKGRFLQVMMAIDSQSSVTRKAARQCLEQKEDQTARLMALNYLSQFPEEIEKQFSLLQKVLNTSDNVPLQLASLSALKGVGVKAQSLAKDVARLGLKNQEDLRRAVALTLKKIDPEGKVSLGVLKKPVYEGVAFESQWIWKVMDTPLTRLELFKSYFYFVTAKRFKFTELTIPPEMEKQLVNCIASADCAHRNAAMAAVVALKSQDGNLPGILTKVMQSKDSSLRWEASGAYLLLYENALGEKRKDQNFSRAWDLQAEALKKGGHIRQIDLEDLILQSPSIMKAERWKFIFKQFLETESLEAADAILLLAAKGSPEAQKIIMDTLKGKSLQKINMIMSRLPLTRGEPLPAWLKTYLK